jgi:steroid delta-isomerase
MKESHPALVAARNSWRFVQAKDRESWLALMAPDVRIEDPIGVGPTNPTGAGVRGLEGVKEFWDKNIGPSTVRIETHESFVAGNESAHVLTLVTTLANGIRSTVRGIFTYRINDAGKLQALRGFWTMEDMKIERAKSSSP